ncbi:hypothetical protein NUSPORA_00441 [Nucleospora cyclopteri]
MKNANDYFENLLHGHKYVAFGAASMMLLMIYILSLITLTILHYISKSPMVVLENLYMLFLDENTFFAIIIHVTAFIIPVIYLFYKRKSKPNILCFFMMGSCLMIIIHLFMEIYKLSTKIGININLANISNCVILKVLPVCFLISIFVFITCSKNDFSKVAGVVLDILFFLLGLCFLKLDPYHIAALFSFKSIFSFILYFENTNNMINGMVFVVLNILFSILVLFICNALVYHHKIIVNFQTINPDLTILARDIHNIANSAANTYISTFGPSGFINRLTNGLNRMEQRVRTWNFTGNLE